MIKNLSEQNAELKKLEIQYELDKKTLKKGGINDFTELDKAYNKDKEKINKTYKDKEIKLENDFQNELSKLQYEAKIQSIKNQREKEREDLDKTYKDKYLEIENSETLTSKQKIKLIEEKNKSWIGFCTYRRFWVKKEKIISNYKDLEENILKYPPLQWRGSESIHTHPIKIKKIKKIKISNNAFIEIIKKPYLFFKKKHNIKDHFYIFHGSNFLDESTKLLKFNERIEFINFLNKDNFNPYNLFFCKDISILKEYYNSVFEWLNLCEKKFGFHDLTGYGKKRIYGFLAERYLSFWFNKYTKSRAWPISYFDTNKSKLL